MFVSRSICSCNDTCNCCGERDMRTPNGAEVLQIIIKGTRGRILWMYLTSLPWAAHATISKRSSSKVQELGPAATPARYWPMRWEPSKLDFTLAAGLVSFSIYIITCQPQILLSTTAGLLLMQ